MRVRGAGPAGQVHYGRHRRTHSTLQVEGGTSSSSASASPVEQLVLQAGGGGEVGDGAEGMAEDDGGDDGSTVAFGCSPPHTGHDAAYKWRSRPPSLFGPQ